MSFPLAKLGSLSHVWALYECLLNARGETEPTQNADGKATNGETTHIICFSANHPKHKLDITFAHFSAHFCPLCLVPCLLVCQRFLSAAGTTNNALSHRAENFAPKPISCFPSVIWRGDLSADTSVKKAVRQLFITFGTKFSSPVRSGANFHSF